MRLCSVSIGTSSFSAGRDAEDDLDGELCPGCAARTEKGGMFLFAFCYEVRAAAAQSVNGVGRHAHTDASIGNASSLLAGNLALV